MGILRALTVGLFVGAGALAQAESFQLSHTFRAPEPADNDYFGTAVAIEGGVVAIKSLSGYLDGDGLSRTHVFEQSASGVWSEAASFDFDSGDNSGNFFIGEELDIDGGVIAVGYGPHSNAGTSQMPLQVITRSDSGWTRTFATLATINPAIDDPLDPTIRRRKFAGRGQRPAGRTVSISGDYIIAEESGVQRPGLRGPTGVARVFERQDDGSWEEESNVFTRAINPTGLSAAAINGNYAALVYRSSTSNDLDEIGSGIYFFERQHEGHWAPTQSFGQPAAIRDFYFHMVRLDGDTAVTRDLIDGDMHIYQRVGGVWTESTAPLPPTAYNGSHTGFALDGNLLARTVVDEMGLNPMVEVYRRDDAGNWNLLDTIADPDPDAALPFGANLDIDGEQLLVGAMWRNPAPPGAAYLFTIVPEPNTLLLGVLALGGLLVGRR